MLRLPLFARGLTSLTALLSLTAAACSGPGPRPDAGADGANDGAADSGARDDVTPSTDARADAADRDGQSVEDAGDSGAAGDGASRDDVTPSDSAGTPVDRDFCATGAAVPGLTAPPGFCVRKYSDVRVARVMALAPNGDLFVAAPTNANATGISGGPGSIVVLHDDEGDGVIEETVFTTGVANVHGIVFSGGFLYWTNDRLVERTPYVAGQRRETAGARQLVIGGPVPDGMGGMIEDPLAAQLQRGGRQTHGLAASPSGRMFVTRGEYSSCVLGPGGVQAVGTGEVYNLGMHSLTRAIHGFRNPMYARCHFSRELCMVAELGEDQTTGAVEKLLVIPSAPQWYGYPCCHRRGVGPQAASGSCNDVQQEAVSINLGDTPFGFDWERGRWPAPYRDGVFVALHGSFYTGNFGGSGVVFLPTDPATGIPRQQAPIPFLATTNGQPTRSLQRPTDVVFAPDGRMFVSDDYGGGVYMVAPIFTR